MRITWVFPLVAALGLGSGAAHAGPRLEKLEPELQGALQTSPAGSLCRVIIRSKRPLQQGDLSRVKARRGTVYAVHNLTRGCAGQPDRLAGRGQFGSGQKQAREPARCFRAQDAQLNAALLRAERHEHGDRCGLGNRGADAAGRSGRVAGLTEGAADEDRRLDHGDAVEALFPPIGG
jgi:hypothetical protein